MMIRPVVVAGLGNAALVPPGCCNFPTFARDKDCRRDRIEVRGSESELELEKTSMNSVDSVYLLGCTYVIA